MKLIKTILLAGASVLGMMTHAIADPITIGGFLFTNTFLSGAFGLGTLITASQIGIGLAVTAGLSLISGLGKRGQATDPGQYRSTFESSDASEVNALGRCKLGGLKVFGNTKGVNRYRLVAHSATPLISAEEYFLGERPVTVEANGVVSSPPYTTPSGSWMSWLVKPSANGLETSWTQLMSEFPLMWTSEHRLRGLTQSLLTYISPGITTEKFGKLYQSGVPDGAIVGRWGKVYDPRESGAVVNNSATWVWSRNGPLCAAHIMRQYPDLADSDFDWNFISGEANRADALVATKTGTEPRSALSGVWLSESKRGDTMQEVLDSIGAEIVLSDTGLIRIRLIDDNPTPEIAFTEKHRINTDWQSGPEAVERPNYCRVRYYSSERGYEMSDIDMTGIAWARVEDEITRYGEKIMDISLPFCPSASQAQRIARRVFLAARGDVGSIVTNMTGMAAWGLSYATVELPDLEESPVCKIAAPRCDDQSGTVEIPYLVWPPELINEPWNPATMEAAAPDPLPDLSYPATLPTPSAPTIAAVVQYDDLSYETRVKFSGVVGGTLVEANYRAYTDGEPDAFAGMTEYETDLSWYGWVVDNTSGVRVDFRSRFFDDDDEGSYFSPLLIVNPMEINNTAPAKPVFDVVVDYDVLPYVFEVTVTSSSLHVAKLAYTGIGTPIENNGRPGIEITDSIEVSPAKENTSFLITAVAYTSDGTPSETAEYLAFVPGYDPSP